VQETNLEDLYVRRLGPMLGTLLPKFGPSSLAVVTRLVASYELASCVKEVHSLVLGRWGAIGLVVQRCLFHSEAKVTRQTEPSIMQETMECPSRSRSRNRRGGIRLDAGIL